MVKRSIFFSLVLLSNTIVNTTNRTFDALLTFTHEQKLFSIDDAISLSRQNRSNLKALEYATLAKHRNELVVISNYLPQISFESNFSQSSFSRFMHSGISVTFSQLILSAAGPLEQLRIAQRDTRIAGLQELLQADAVRAEAEKTFFDLYGITSKMDAITSLDFAITISFKRAAAARDVDLLSVNDWLLAQASYEQNLSAVRTYTQDVIIARNTMERTIEATLSHENIADESMQEYVRCAQHELKSLDYYLAQAGTSRKELHIKSEEILQEKANRQFYERSYFPTISSFFNITRGGAAITNFATSAVASALARVPVWEAGILISWSFDGLQNAHKAHTQQALIVAKTMEKQNVDYQVTLDVRNAYAKILSQLEVVSAQEARFAQAVTDYDKAKCMYSIGVTSDAEILEAEYQWKQAEFALLDVKKTLAQAYSSLLFACGYPDAYKSF